MPDKKPSPHYLAAQSRMREEQKCAKRFDDLCAEMPADQVFSFVHRYVVCGRASCVHCPHGPYWYAFWRQGKVMKNRYLGRHLPTRAKSMTEKKRRRKHARDVSKAAKERKRKVALQTSIENIQIEPQLP